MNTLIELWKSKGNFSEGLELVELYQPDHPLLPQLRKGVSPINKLYLKKAINGLDVTSLKAVRPVEPKPKEEAVWLYRRLKELIQLKNKTRNQYHEVRTVEARKKINRQLKTFRSEIHQIARQIDYYESTGHLPSIPEPPKAVPLSDDPAELIKELLRVRPNLSKVRRRLTIAYERQLPKKTIEKLEKKQQDLITKKKSLEQRINDIRKE